MTLESERELGRGGHFAQRAEREKRPGEVNVSGAWGLLERRESVFEGQKPQV